MRPLRTTILFALVGITLVAIAYSLVESSSPVYPENSNNKLSWLTFNAGMDQSVKENKKILVDVYTDWCGWCKKMDKEVYTDAKVIALLNEKFVVIKLNAESSNKLSYNGKEFTEQEFARTLGIDGYPTTVFFEPDSKPITRIPGYVETKTFTQVLNYIGDDHYKTISYQDFLLKQGNAQ